MPPQEKQATMIGWQANKRAEKRGALQRRISQPIGDYQARITGTQKKQEHSLCSAPEEHLEDPQDIQEASKKEQEHIRN